MLAKKQTDMKTVAIRTSDHRFLGTVRETEDPTAWEDDATLARMAGNSFDASLLESRRRKESKAEPDAYLAANTVVEQ